MPAKRTAMRKIRDVLRLRLEAGLSIRQIKASTKVSVGAIQKLLSQAELLGLSWPLAPDLDDAQLAQMLYLASFHTPWVASTHSAEFAARDQQNGKSRP